jgi:hypothetical protein
MFENSSRDRSKSIVRKWLERHNEESAELKQLIKNHVDKAGVFYKKIDPKESQDRITTFLQDEKASLRVTLRNDRLSVLYDPSDTVTSIDKRDISPRHLVPEKYCLKLLHLDGRVFKISLTMLNGEGEWVHLDCSNDKRRSENMEPLEEIVTNLRCSLKCAVLGIEGKSCLYQTTPMEKELNNRDCDTGKDIISVRFMPVDCNDGTQESNEEDIHENLTILGLNHNLRLHLLMHHVESTGDDFLVSEPIKHIIGAGYPIPLLEDLQKPYLLKQWT